ncbi:SMC-Scp complex subunit ScpB [Chitinophaga japonensis]|uniref:Segregation and condensation protein B n=1 Tax=Chitinophaga japonensis TaxID=104662 RepID=A0A562TBZ5_CHIJA|nr:SMC-Scp complex subunit ScpB [Chitinophaga japonensis]TWI91077.1 segregation and condensation protein B [Chitinophaga japonensis]
MEISQIIPHVEALIFAADRPLPVLEIVELLNNALAFLEDRATLDQVETAIEAIREKYASEFYAFEVRESGGGYQFLTKKDYYQTVAQLNGEKFLKRLSTAALETLAIIAYKQPISKGEIEHIRGVSSDYSIQKLLEKELIIISGRSEELPGKPLLYATSKAFMDYFGLNSPADLPKLREVFDEEAIQPTLITDEAFHSNNGNGLVVSENGELLNHFIPTVTITEETEAPAEETETEPGIDTPPEDESEGAAAETPEETVSGETAEEVSGEMPEDDMPEAATTTEAADPDAIIPGEEEEEEEEDELEEMEEYNGEDEDEDEDDDEEEDEDFEEGEDDEEDDDEKEEEDGDDDDDLEDDEDDEDDEDFEEDDEDDDEEEDEENEDDKEKD